ncbi:hypothetical protein KKA89_00470 [Patescibacteria group bacterium]|nr:hypothetical protein [Patescibacteria group bacterium]MBU2460785.1 hypothetical protein [Patescibacteria group bacterium]
MNEIVDYLLSKGYEKEYEDSWMFWQDKKIDSSCFNEIKKVKNEND